ncbi:hypothetical protein, partial [Leptospira interrogans]|uniref:hypothetical protein n=1 Tax=Leptospira interrogans TaxID=173 RepID=UPI003F6826F6
HSLQSITIFHRTLLQQASSLHLGLDFSCFFLHFVFNISCVHAVLPSVYTLSLGATSVAP